MDRSASGAAASGRGAITISQQLSRSIFLDIQRTWSRKILEAGLAFYLEAFYSKPQLLEMYLNQVYWGQDGADSLIGLESTSRSYFGKGARDLTLGESALLAGLLQSPNHYSPRADPKIALQRRNLVLALMENQKLITPVAIFQQRRKSRSNWRHYPCARPKRPILWPPFRNPYCRNIP